MRLPILILTTTLVCIAGCEERATVVTLDKIPVSVTAAAVTSLPGFTASAAEIEVEDGGTSYTLCGTAAGLKAKIEIEVSADGRATVEECETDVVLDQIPAATRDAALKAVPGLVITKAERETKKDTVSWTLVGTAAGKQVEVEVKADGSTEIESGDEGHDDKDGHESRKD